MDIKMDIKKKRIIQAAVLATAAVMLFYGIARGEAAVVFNKAVNVCFECIGLG